MFSLSFNNKFIYIFNSLVSPLTILVLFRYLDTVKTPVLNFMGANSLYILGLHGGIILLSEHFLPACIFDKKYILWILVLAVNCLIILLINRLKNLKVKKSIG